MAFQKKEAVNQDLPILQKDIRSKSFRRVYLLYGDEDYLVQQFKHELIRAAVDPEDTMNLNVHREEKPDWSLVQDEILTLPFFAERRMVVLEGTGLFAADAPDAEASSGSLTAAFLEQIPESTVVLFVERPDQKRADGRKGKSSVDRRGKLYKAVRKSGLAVELTHPDEADRRKWVLARLTEEKVSITGRALERFMNLAGEQMSHIRTELEKLISYAGEGGAVRPEDVEALVSVQPEDRVFRMIDAIARRDRLSAFSMYRDLLELRQPPIKILSILMQQYNRILLVRDLMDRGLGADRIASELSLHVWQARQTADQARHFSREQLLDAVKECVRMQEAAQSGHIDMQLGVELLIIKLSHG